jgi:transcriptional regulator with XRE-family HTH domain
MPPERSKQLVFELDAWYRSNHMPQKDLAATIGVTPQGLSEILSLRSRPSGETVLRIVEFLKENMSSGESIKTLSNALDRIAADREKIITLTAQLKAKTTLPTVAIQPPPAVTIPPITKPKPPAAKPIKERSIAELRNALGSEKDPTARFDIYKVLKAKEANGLKATGDQAPPFDPASSPTWKPVEVSHAPPPKSLPMSANTPFLVGEILKLTSFEDLQSMLGNPALSPLQHSLVFTEIKTRRTLLGSHI